VPLRLITVVPLVVELLVRVSWPVTGPGAEGRNCTLRVAVWEGFKVSGNVAPENVNPVPVSAAELTVTGSVPVDVKVSDCVAAVFTATSSKAKLLVLLNVDVAALNCRGTLRELLPVLAVKVTDCVVNTDDILAVN
jgi:hypothetical protein